MIFGTAMSSTNRKLLYALRERYGDMLDGFKALCSCAHEERNIMLSHYVANVRSLSKKKIKTEQEKLVPVSGRSLRTYLNSLMRGLKMYEKEFGLAHLYGKDWSWSTSDDNETCLTALNIVTIIIQETF